MGAFPLESSIWNIINRLLGRADRESLRRAEIKKTLYPKIISDLKFSLRLYRERFLIPQTSSGNFFTFLRNIDHSEELRRINTFDMTLYQYLRRILELYPEIEHLGERKQKTRKDIERAWESYVNQLREEGIIALLERRVNPFLNEVSSGVYWILCINEIEKAREIYNDVLFRIETNTGIPDFSKIFPESFFDNLVRIFNENWESILSEFNRIESQLKEIIEDDILPYIKREMDY